MGICFFFLRGNCGPKKGQSCCLRENLSSLSTDAASKLNVLGHDCDTLGVDGAQVGVFEKANKVSFGSFLEGHDSGRLESQVSLEILGDFTNKALEWQLADEKLGALLVTTDLSQSNGTGPVPVGLLHSSSGRGRLASGFGSQLLAWGLASGRFTRGLFSTSHCDERKNDVLVCPPKWTLFKDIRVADFIFGWAVTRR